ncbi:MAG: hypothetical protein HFI54_11910 [Lachnospiraceae bacterium]|nr:hypothetical protein [Lachnospiraceae bacterium]
MTRYKMILTTLLFAFLLTACGENEELTAYQEDMNTFFERASEYNDKMNAIDRESDTAVIELLGYLDAFAEDIQWMAELEVPEQFSAVESLADEADENMKEAVALFHTAYDGETYDEGSEQAALEYYNRTNIRIQYIITILHGEIPEGEGVTYTEENSLLGGGYLNKKDEEEETEESEETVSPDGDEDVPEDNFDTDDTVFYTEPSETDGE